MQVNGYLKKGRVIFFLVLSVLVLALIFFSYSRLSVKTQTPIAPSAPTVERGSIVDRNGKPVAVPTRFYHFGVTPKMITNPDSFAAVMAPVLEMPAEEFGRLMEKTKDIAARVVNNLHANGCNILINTNEVAGQTVMHTHVHIIPRYDENDSISIQFNENKLDLDEVLKQINQD